MKKRFVLILSMTVSFMMFSCDFYLSCLKGNGAMMTIERDIDSFTGVISNGSFNVEVRRENDFSLHIEADENLLPYIESYVRGVNLVLEVKRGRCIKTQNHVKITVGMPEIKLVRLAGSGNVYCHMVDTETAKLELLGSGNIDCDEVIVTELDAKLSGSGDIMIKGTAEKVEVDIMGSGDVRAIDLLTSQCFSGIMGSGNLYISVQDYLKANITGSGSIFYKGEPEINSTITGSGKIVKY